MQYGSNSSVHHAVATAATAPTATYNQPIYNRFPAWVLAVGSSKILSLLSKLKGMLMTNLLICAHVWLQFADHMLGTCWVDNDEFQSFCIEFLHHLRLARFNLLYNQPGPCKDNSPISAWRQEITRRHYIILYFSAFCLSIVDLMFVCPF